MKQTLRIFKDALVGESNGYKFWLYPLPRKGGDEHTPPHLHAEYGGRKGKFFICNSKKGQIGDMYDECMTPKEQKFVKAWILEYKSKLNRRWRSQNLTHVESTHIRDTDAIRNITYALRQMIEILKRTKTILKRSRTMSVLRKIKMAIFYCSLSCHILKNHFNFISV